MRIKGKDIKPVSVMVTGIGGGGHGEQILKALRLADTPYEIVGGDMSPYSSGLMLVDHPYILPPANDKEYVDVLLKVCKRHNVNVLFHGSEPELNVMSRERKRFEEHGIFLPINPASVLELCMNKNSTMDFLKQSGFEIPSFVTVRSVSELEAFDNLPAVLKPSIGGGGSSNIFLAQTRDELLAFGLYLLKLYPEFVVQEYVGTPDNEYTVGILLDMDGTLINSIAVRRNILSSLSNAMKVQNRTNRKELGPVLAISSGISQGEIGSFPHVCMPCEQIATRLGARGAINIQCRYVDGKVFVFEINPRFSGTTSLRAMAGYNEPDILIRRHILNEDIRNHFQYESGVITRSLAETFVKKTDYRIAREINGST